MKAQTDPNEYAETLLTYTGKSCEDCLVAGRNHCSLGKQEGMCCDVGDPKCRKAADNIDPANICAEDVNYDYATSFLTCPTTDRCPSGNTDLYIN